MDNPLASDRAAFATTVSTVRAAVSMAARRGDAAGMSSLEARLDALMIPSPAFTTRTRDQALIEIAHASVVSTAERHLTARTKRTLRDALRATSSIDPFADDPWAPLDPSACEVRARLTRSALITARRDAVGACRHYGRTRRTGFLRDAVKSLESAAVAESAINGSRLTPATCEAEFTRLGAALAGSMTPWAWAVFGAELKREATTSREASGIRMDGPLRKRFDAWFEGWEIDVDAEPLMGGTFFEEPLRSRFEEVLDVERRARAAYDAKQAEQHRRFEEWQALRDAEKRAKATEQRGADLTEDATDGGRTERDNSDGSDRHDPSEGSATGAGTATVRASIVRIDPSEGPSRAETTMSAVDRAAHLREQELRRVDLAILEKTFGLTETASSAEGATGAGLEPSDPPGPMAPAPADPVREALAWQGRHDRAYNEQEEARKYYCERTGKRYEPRPRRN